MFCLLIIVCIFLFHIVVEGSYKDVQFVPMKATAYSTDKITTDGSHTRKGICASKSEWIGLTAMVYTDNDGRPDKFLGYYEIKDDGGLSTRSGKKLKIWLPKDESKEFGVKKVLVVLVNGVG